MRSSHFEVTVRANKWVVMEVFGVVERIVYEAQGEEDADKVCKEYNDQVSYPIA